MGLIYHHAVPRAVEIIYGSGTVIARQADAHNQHPDLFDFCRRCGGVFGWFPDRDVGIVMYHAGGARGGVRGDPAAPRPLGFRSIGHGGALG